MTGTPSVVNGHDRRKTGRSPEMSRRNNAGPSSPYVVSMSLRAIALTSLSFTLLAFVVGRATRIAIINNRQSQAVVDKTFYSIPHNVVSARGELEGKNVPPTVYTSKTFDTRVPVTSSSFLIRPGNGDESNSGEELEHNEFLPDFKEEGSTPSGQHLLIDMKGVDGTFLNSESRLVNAILDTCKEADLTLLSYHCHSMVPMGVSCAGLLVQSHISFHTWPEEGVITLDLFTSGIKQVPPVVPIIERFFAVPPALEQGGVGESPSTVWAQKDRGIPIDIHENDLQSEFLMNMQLALKEQIASIETDFQRIDIYDVIETRLHDDFADYEKSLSNDGSYQAQNPQLFMPDRIIFLDGIQQSTREGEAAYHEILVHPAMFAHENPQRVAIVGGGEGATLREVLKHRTVKEVVMVEIDEDMVDVSKEYIPSWSDCSDLVGSADVCFDDPRAEVYFEDALAWFIDRYSEDEHDDEQEFDVIIMDALDPNFDVAFSDELYRNAQFTKSLYNALSNDGIFVIQTGEAPNRFDVPDESSPMMNRAILTRQLQNSGFKSLTVYEEAHCEFEYPWSFLVAFKDSATRKMWHSNEAQVELAMHKRAMPTKSGKAPFFFFDGATMTSVQRVHKAFEGVFCNQKPTPKECDTLRGFNVTRPNAPVSNFEMKMSNLSKTVGSGVYAKVDIAMDTYLALEKSAESIRFASSCWKVVGGLLPHGDGDALRSIYNYAQGYGFDCNSCVEVEESADSSIFAFMNEPQEGSCMVEWLSTVSEMSEDPYDSTKGGLLGSIYNPVVARNLPKLSTRIGSTSRHIVAGEEILVGTS